MLYNNSSFWSWPIASTSTTWVSLKSDTLAWVFNHAVWGPGAGSREKERREIEREKPTQRDTEIDVKRREESEKDCSGKGNRGLNSDEIIQFVELTVQTDREMSSSERTAALWWPAVVFITDPVLPALLITKWSSLSAHFSPWSILLNATHEHNVLMSHPCCLTLTNVCSYAYL